MATRVPQIGGNEEIVDVNTTPLIDGVDGAKTVATAWAAIESAANGGKPVEVRNEF